MSDTPKSKKPSHIAYTVRDYKGNDGKDKASWQQIGVAWQHKDGKGYDIALQALPVDGRFTLRVNEPKKADGGEAE